jgi:endonuclease YncB( thermonuclease family)
VQTYRSGGAQQLAPQGPVGLAPASVDDAELRTAIAECHKVDRYGRQVCRVIVSGVDVCLEQVRSGMAWHFKRYEHEQTEAHRRAYADAELEARQARVGLWSTPEQVAPWEWRAKRSENR